MGKEVIVMSDFYRINIETGEYTEKVILDIEYEENSKDDEAIISDPERQV